jgi:hypothetical protein
VCPTIEWGIWAAGGSTVLPFWSLIAASNVTVHLDKQAKTSWGIEHGNPSTNGLDCESQNPLEEA